MEGCDFYTDGHCTMFRKNGKCKPSDSSWCDEDMLTIESNQICRHGSVFGNNYFYITEEQIEALREGKVLYYPGEYGTFIALKK